MTRPLSPAAQAVLAAAENVPIPGDSVWGVMNLEIAAALRALADQVVPGEPEYMRDAIPELAWWDKHDLVRSEILTIAAELEGGHD